MSFLNKFKKFEKVRFAIGLIVVGLIISIIAGVVLTRPDGSYQKTNAIITSIDEETIGEDTNCTVTVEYEVGGRKYTVELGAYQSGWTVGSEIECEYNTDNPSQIRTGNGKLVALVLCTVGAAAIVFGVFQIVKDIKTPSSKLSQYNKVNNEMIDGKVAEEIRNSNESKHDYVFHFTGKLNQSYIMESSTGSPIYEALCDGVTLVKDTKYEFKNHITGNSETKMISHTVSHSYGSEGLGMTISSAFNIDGQNCWDVLASKGYGFDFSLNGVKAHYEVKHMGVNIGYVELGGTALYNEKYENNPLGKIPTNGIFKVNCPASEVEEMFLICFCLSKTEHTIN